MSEATQSQTQTLEQSLNKTDFGHTLYENRKAFFGALIAVIVGAVGYTLWKQTTQSKALENSVQVFEFQKKYWLPAKEGKVSTTELVSAFKGLDGQVQASAAMVPTMLEMGKFLYEKDLAADADTVLAYGSDVKDTSLTFFLNLQRAVVQEKLGKIDEAITSLEKISGKDTFMPARVGVELGRLYLLKGDKGKAQSQFENVVSTYPNDSEAKMAKLYLGQMSR